MRKTHPNIDPDKVYAYGYSNGGMMALRLGREAGDVFAAVASVAGVDPAPTNDECQDGSRISPALIAHGTADRMVPFTNKCTPASLCRLGHHETILRWIDRTLSPTVGNTVAFDNINAGDASMLACSEHLQSGGVPGLLACVIDGGGHVEHSIAVYVGAAAETLLGRQNRDAEAVEETGKFFMLHRLPGAK